MFFKLSSLIVTSSCIKLMHHNMDINRVYLCINRLNDQLGDISSSLKKTEDLLIHPAHQVCSLQCQQERNVFKESSKHCAKRTHLQTPSIVITMQEIIHELQ